MSGNDPKFMHDFIKLYLDSAPGYLQQIETAFQTNDWKTISFVVHKMKPSVELFGMKNLVPHLRDLENLVRANGEIEECIKLYHLIVPYLSWSITSLEEELNAYL